LLYSLLLCLVAFAPLQYEWIDPWLSLSTLLLALAFLVLFYGHLSIHRSPVDRPLPPFIFPILFLAWFLLLLSFVLEYILLSVFKLSQFYLMTDVTISIWLLCVFCYNLYVYVYLSSLHYQPLIDNNSDPKNNVILIHPPTQSPLFVFHLSVFLWSLGLLVLFFYDLCFQIYHFDTSINEPSLLHSISPFLHLILILLFSVWGSPITEPSTSVPIFLNVQPSAILVAPLENLPLVTTEKEDIPNENEHSVSIELSPPNETNNLS